MSVSLAVVPAPAMSDRRRSASTLPAVAVSVPHLLSCGRWWIMPTETGLGLSPRGSRGFTDDGRLPLTEEANGEEREEGDGVDRRLVLRLKPPAPLSMPLAGKMELRVPGSMPSVG